MPSKIPATVITGFLGAGKTSMVRHLLENANGKHIALIINEFGDIGVDADLLKGCGIAGCAEEDVIELANGCICCTVAEDFVPAMTRLISRDPQPDHIVIETSGLALPQPLIRAFKWPDIRNRVTVDGVIALIDAPAVHEGRFASDEAAVDAQRARDGSLDHETPLSELFEDQLASADLVVLNKTDLVDEAAVAGIEESLRKEVRPGVRLIRTVHGAVPPQTLLGLNLGAEDDLEARREVHHLHEEGGSEDEHGHGHDEFESFQVTLGAIADPKRFADRVREVIHRFDILRLKGFGSVEGKPMRLVVQAVGPRIEHYFDRPLTAAEAGKTELVVIGLAGLDRGAIEKALVI